MSGKGRFPISAVLSRLETLSNDVDALALFVTEIACYLLHCAICRSSGRCPGIDAFARETFCHFIDCHEQYLSLREMKIECAFPLFDKNQSTS